MATRLEAKQRSIPDENPYFAPGKLTSYTDVGQKWAFEHLNQPDCLSQLKGAAALVACFMTSGPEAIIKLGANVWNATQDTTLQRFIYHSPSDLNRSIHGSHTDGESREEKSSPQFIRQQFKQRNFIFGAAYFVGCVISQQICSTYGPLGFIGATIGYAGYQLGRVKTE